MKSPLLSLRLLLVLAVAGIFTARAADQPAAANVNVDFTIIVLGDKPVNDLVYLSSGKATAFQAPSYSRSASYHYSGPSTMTFYRLTAQPDGSKKPVEVGHLEVPTGSTKMLVLMVPGGTDYTMGAVNDANNSLTYGKTRLYNATPLPLQILCNKTDKIELKPFEAKTVDSKDGGIALSVSVQKDGEWQAVVNNVYLVAADQKLNLFLLTSYSKALFQNDVQMFKLFEGKNPPPPPASTPGSTRRGINKS